MLFRKTKARLLYMAIIRQTLMYGCEAWTMTKQTKRNLRQAQRITELNSVGRLGNICPKIFEYSEL